MFIVYLYIISKLSPHYLHIILYSLKRTAPISYTWSEHVDFFYIFFLLIKVIAISKKDTWNQHNQQDPRSRLHRILSLLLFDKFLVALKMWDKLYWPPAYTADACLHHTLLLSNIFHNRKLHCWQWHWQGGDQIIS